MPRLFCFGLGYSARRVADAALAEGWSVAGTCRSAEKAQALREAGVDAHVFDRGSPMAIAAQALHGVTHVLSSVPPDADGDPVLDHHGADLLTAEDIEWAGYLSTTGVYGDTGGGEVDEESPLNPGAERSVRRALAEEGWRLLWERHGIPTHIFRLAGIYGPGRSAFDTIRAGRARRIDKPGHVFSRIHVDDIAAVVRASMAAPAPGRIYNVCDDEPAAPGDVIAYACDLIGETPPDPIPFDEAAQSMSPMGLSFWNDNRRVSNARIKTELGVALRYPTYREGLKALA
jgi:nucleoside-diphosphate-sugar epimerase